MSLLTQTTAITRVFQLGNPSVAPTGFQISKNGGAFGAPTSATVTSLGSGFFSISLSASDTNTVGDLAYLFTGGTGVTQPITVDQVIANLPGTGIGSQKNDGTATLSVKSVQINNASGIGLSIVGSTFGLDIESNPGTAVNIRAASTAIGVVSTASNAMTVNGNTSGITIIGSNSFAMEIESLASTALIIQSTNGIGLNVTGTTYGATLHAGSGDTLYLQSSSGYGLNATASLGIDSLITPTPIVELAASQPLYAPAKAGDQMDLINAPNSVALADFWSSGGLYIGGQLNNGTAALAAESLTINNPSGVAVTIQGQEGIDVNATVGNAVGLIGTTVGLLVNGNTGILTAGNANAGFTAASTTGPAINAQGFGNSAVMLYSPGFPGLDYTQTTGFDPSLAVALGPVELAASQPLYAPAIAGDQMDLVDSPNPLALSAIASALLLFTDGIETGYTLQGALRILLSACGGMSTIVSNTRIYRDVNNTVNRITATVDASGQRLSVTLDAT